MQAKVPITLGALHVNQLSSLHLPSECFVEYQLRAQASVPDRFVACAAYGDCGPWYIPTADAYPQGGYAVSVASCARTSTKFSPVVSRTCCPEPKLNRGLSRD